MSVEEENQRIQKRIALKALYKCNRILSNMGVSTRARDYSELERITRGFNPVVIDLAKREFNRVYSEKPTKECTIDVVINRDKEIVLPITRTDLKTKDSAAYVLYSSIGGGKSYNERIFADYIVLDVPKNSVNEALRTLSRACEGVNVNIARGFNFETTRSPNRSYVKAVTKKEGMPYREISDEDKTKIKELCDRGIWKSRDMMSYLSREYGVMQIAGVIATYKASLKRK